ncbi:MAG: AAA family ATPase [Candidatus Kapabacteria bacterium]|nr:AAA family ATPase [Candidatus Kapabacteria bacterium]
MNQIFNLEKNAQQIELINLCANNLNLEIGTIICVSGEQGFGKSHLLNILEKELGSKVPHALIAQSQCLAPIGNFKLAQIQPLLPIIQVIEQLATNKESSPEKKFAISTGMTVLASLPIAGELFYAFKEISKDYKQLKSEKQAKKENTSTDVVKDYFNVISLIAEKTPLLILIDDIHWSDIQTIQLINLFAQNINKSKVTLVLTFRQSVLQSSASPMLTFIDEYSKNNNEIIFVQLEPFSLKQIHSVCSRQFVDYKPNKEFEEWLLSRTHGIPAVVLEYCNFFRNHNPFNENGSLSENFYNSDFVPASLHAAFAQNLEILTEEERNTLSVCSSEGVEFTVSIVSNLLNSDFLTTIKKLRALQNKTGVILSIGTKIRYGIKTTVYRFTQGFYHSYFQKSLEYEEHIALQTQITALLKQKYEEAENEEVKQHIAPFLAAHSAESGDNETAKQALLACAEAAEKYGDTDSVLAAYKDYQEIIQNSQTPNDKEDTENLAFQELIRKSLAQNPNLLDSVSKLEEDDFSKIISKAVNFNDVRKVLVSEYLKDKFTVVADLAQSYLEKKDADLDDSQKSQLYSIASKARFDSGNILDAANLCSTALDLAYNCKDSAALCFALNTKALIEFKKGGYHSAHQFIVKSAKEAVKMPIELRLLTIANIAIIMKENKDKDNRRYAETARRLCYELNFREFADVLTDF